MMAWSFQVGQLAVAQVPHADQPQHRHELLKMYSIMETNVQRAAVLNALVFNLTVQQMFISNGIYFVFPICSLFLGLFDGFFTSYGRDSQPSVHL
jgi:hypothetical protein